MNPRRLSAFGPALLVMLAVLCLPMIGCVGQGEPYQVNPFAAPGGPCPDGACPCPDGACPGPGGTCPDGSCPGGQCPTPNQGGTEVSSGSPYQVNELALIETKTGPQDAYCPTCPQRQPRIAPTASPLQAYPASRPIRDSPADEVKRGAFRCERCQRPTVGRDWQEIWADDGTSLMCMCRECFAKASPAERESILRSYAARSSIDLLRQPAVELAIKEASGGR